MISPPLDGVRVLEFGQYIAGPSATQLLLNQGAEVIKVEAPAGDAARSGSQYGRAMFDAYNRGKRFVCLDLTKPDHSEVARSLASTCDIVVSNLRPGSLRNFGLDLELLSTGSSQLVCVEISGFGTVPELASRPGLDIAAQAESGMMSINGTQDAEPTRVGFAAVDAVAGYIAAQSALAAYIGMLRTGQGAYIPVSLLDVAIHAQGATWTGYALSGTVPRRRGNGQPGIAPAADLVPVADGYIVLSAYVERHWNALCSVAGVNELASDVRFATAQSRAEFRSELLDSLASAFRGYARDDIVRRLAEAGVVVGSVRDYAEVPALRGVDAASPFAPAAPEEREFPWTLGVAASWPGVAVPCESPGPVGRDNASVLGHLCDVNSLS